MMLSNHTKHRSKGVVFRDKYNIKSVISSTGNKILERYGVTAAGIRYRVSRNAIYEWKAKYDGSWKSLRDRSHRPHSHPKQHTEEGNALIKRYYRYNKEDKLMLWDKLRANGIRGVTKACSER